MSLRFATIISYPLKHCLIVKSKCLIIHRLVAASSIQWNKCKIEFLFLFFIVIANLVWACKVRIRCCVVLLLRLDPYRYFCVVLCPINGQISTTACILQCLMNAPSRIINFFSFSQLSRSYSDLLNLSNFRNQKLLLVKPFLSQKNCTK